jgi:FkbM family methyltransferase
MQVEPMRKEELSGFKAHKEEFKLVFDVGARGNTEFLEIHPDCEYHLFEPQVEYSNHLKESTKDMPNVTINQCGLGDEIVKAVKFYSNVESFEPHPWIASTHNEADVFDIDTVDEYCKAKGIQEIDFLKIDTEGYDFRILLGAKDMLEKNAIKYIQFEYWDGVRKFYNMLSDKYEMHFMCEDQNILELNEEMIQHIDNVRIPGGMGGDVFCKIKTWN